MPQYRKPTPRKRCVHCGTPMERKRRPNGKLETSREFCIRKYCDRRCMAKAYDEQEGAHIHPETKRHHARKKVPPGPCRGCGAADARDVHHIDGDVNNNQLHNLERLCQKCHNRLHWKERRIYCKICGERQKGLGLCEKHYKRFKVWGDPRLVKKPWAAVPHRVED